MAVCLVLVFESYTLWHPRKEAIGIGLQFLAGFFFALDQIRDKLGEARPKFAGLALPAGRKLTSVATISLPVTLLLFPFVIVFIAAFQGAPPTKPWFDLVFAGLGSFAYLASFAWLFGLTSGWLKRLRIRKRLLVQNEDSAYMWTGVILAGASVFLTFALSPLAVLLHGTGLVQLLLTSLFLTALVLVLLVLVLAVGYLAIVGFLKVAITFYPRVYQKVPFWLFLLALWTWGGMLQLMGLFGK